jgi:hypothetical protein
VPFWATVTTQVRWAEARLARAARASVVNCILRLVVCVCVCVCVGVKARVRLVEGVTEKIEATSAVWKRTGLA